jgi:hypothetical protein
MTGFSRCYPPVIAVLALTTQQVQFMITNDALRTTGPNPPHDLAQYSRTVRAAIRQVADKYEPPSIDMLPVRAIAEMAQQVFERVDLAVDIADDIDRTEPTA